MEGANCPILYNLETQKSDICVIFAKKNHGWQRNWGDGTKLVGFAARLGPKTATASRSAKPD